METGKESQNCSEEKKNIFFCLADGLGTFLGYETLTLFSHHPCGFEPAKVPHLQAPGVWSPLSSPPEWLFCSKP